MVAVEAAERTAQHQVQVLVVLGEVVMDTLIAEAYQAGLQETAQSIRAVAVAEAAQTQQTVVTVVLA